MTIWNGSVIRKILFEEAGLESAFQNGVLGKTFTAFAQMIARFSAAIHFIVAHNALVSASSAFFDSILCMSVRGFGLFFAALGGADVVLKLVLSREKDLVFFAGAGLIVLGAVLIVLNRSLAGLYNGSFLARLIGRYFGLRSIEEKACARYYPVLFGLLGLILGAVAAFFSLTVFIMAAGGLIGACLVLYKTEIGIFATAFFMPLLPTWYILGLAMLTVLSFLIKWAVTGSVKASFGLLDLFVALFGLTLLVTGVALSYNPKSSAVVAATYILFLLFYFVVKNVINTRKKLMALLSFIVVSGGLVALYGVYQYVTGSYIDTEAWLDSEMFEGVAARIYSTLDNPNVLGEYLLFIIPLAFAMLYYFKEYFNKIVAFGLCGVTALCMILTFSRGAWLGLLLGILVFIFLKDRRLLWLGLIALVLAPFIVPQSVIDRLMSIGNMSDGSTSYRVNIWLASLNMLATFWLSGIGLGTETFVYIYRKFSFNAVNAPHSHNLYLQLMIDLGVIGLILFAVIMAVFYKKLFLTVNRSKDSFITATGAALCAGMAGFLLQGMTDNVWYNYRVVIFFWLIVALSGALAKIREGQTNETH
jgi:O-antigen ligase